LTRPYLSTQPILGLLIVSNGIVVFCYCHYRLARGCRKKGCICGWAVLRGGIIIFQPVSKTWGSICEGAPIREWL